MKNDNPKLKKFILHWLDKKTETVTGETIADACNRAGIGQGALPALNYFEEVKEESGEVHPPKP